MERRLLPCLLTLLCALSFALAQAPAPVTAPAPPAPTSFETKYPATAQPDQIVLTWAGNPANSISIQWRTSLATPRGAVAFLPRSQADSFTPAPFQVVAAESRRLVSPSCVNDPFSCHHTVRLTHLKPDTEYVYAVGDGSARGWGVRRAFRTAPVRPDPFAFIYMGDAQYGFSRWGALQQAAARQRPDAAFFLMGGDLVTRGNDRDDWDDLLVHASGVFSHIPVMPAVGNHECKGSGFPMLYRDLFDLPVNGPEEIDPERAYALTYGDALFVTLDSNADLPAQAVWLDQTLAASRATWKFVTFHHPLYSSEPTRDNKAVRETWGPIFDKHHVDLVFQGHDHAYLRTFPLKAGQKVASPAEGTIYLIGTSGTKMYEQAQRDYTEVGFVQVATYSVIDILPADSKVGDRLTCRTYDLEGNLKDQFAIDKGSAPTD